MKYPSVVTAMIGGALLINQQYIGSFIAFFFAMLFSYMPYEMTTETEGNDV